MSIHRISGWEKKVGNALGYPVFFYWNYRPFLLTLSDLKNTGWEAVPEYKAYLQIHELLLNTRSKEE